MKRALFIALLLVCACSKVGQDLTPPGGGLPAAEAAAGAIPDDGFLLVNIGALAETSGTVGGSSPGTIGGGVAVLTPTGSGSTATDTTD